MRLKSVHHAEINNVAGHDHKPSCQRGQRHPAHRHGADERIRHRIGPGVGVRSRAYAAHDKTPHGQHHAQHGLAGQYAEERHRPVPPRDDATAQSIPHENQSCREEQQKMKHCWTERLPDLPDRIGTCEQRHALQQHHAHNPPAPRHAQQSPLHDARQHLVQNRQQQHRRQAERHMPRQTQHADRLRHVQPLKELMRQRVPEKRERRLRRTYSRRHRHILPHARRQPGVAPIP